MHDAGQGGWGAAFNFAAGVNPAVRPSKPLAAQKVSAGELGPHPRSTQMLDRLAEPAVGNGALLRRARERASIPSAHLDLVAWALLARRFRASVARSVPPVRVAGSTNSLKPQFSATTSWYSLADRAAATASSYWPKPLQRTAHAYSQMARPIPRRGHPPPEL